MSFFSALALILSLSIMEAQAFIPEASGGAMVGSNLIVAGDEEPAALWIGTDLKVMNKIKVQGAKWDDMEGLATINENMFFAITSHSLTKKGKRRPEREQLLLMKVSKNKVEAVKSWNLREEILSYISKNLSEEVDVQEVITGTPNTGLNIEGLAYLNQKLYLGLRSPLTKDGKAIILEVSNAETSPVVTGHSMLDLKGRGIRSLETDESKILILSGSQDDTDIEFGLHHYSPDVTSTSALIVQGFKNLMRPESVVKENKNSLIFLQDFQDPQAQDVLVRLPR